MTDQYSTPNVLQQHILLFGANYRAMFYVARKLYHIKYKIDVIDWENIPIEYSKYINKYYRIDGRDINKARTLLIDILAHQKYKTVIPINDVGILMCKMFSADISAFSSIIMSNINSLVYAYNKYELYKKSIQCGFGEYLVALVKDKDELTHKINEVNLNAVVLKSCCSKKIFDSQIKTYSVYKSCSKSEILNRFTDESEFPLMIQKCVKGQEIGFNFIALDGEIKAYYIDEFHCGSFGTECVSRKSKSDIPQLYNKIERLVKSIKWNGLGMFDIIVNGEDFYILELNGRFWASIDLSDNVGSGIWEAYESMFVCNSSLTQKSNIKRDGIVLINLQSSIKKILKDITHTNHWKESFKILSTITKSIFSKRYFLQEHLWEDKSFYFHLLIHHIKRI